MQQAAAKLRITASTLCRRTAGCRCFLRRTRTGWPELIEGLLAIALAVSCLLYGLRKYGKTLQQALAEDVSA